MKRPVLALVVTVAGIVVALAGCSAATPTVAAGQAAGDQAETDTAPNFGGATLGTLHYTQGSPAAVLSLPKATGGNGALSYRLTPGPDWSFEPDARTLSIMPRTVGSWSLVYRVDDADGNTADSDADQIRFTITIDPKRVSTYRGSGNEFFVLNPDGERMDEEVSLVLASASAQVYVIATNTRSYRVTSRIDPVHLSSPPPPSVPRPVDPEAVAHAHADDAGHSYHPSLDDLQFVPAGSPGRAAAMAEPRPPAREGDAFTFWDVYPEEPREVPAVARRVVTDGAMSAVFWVADDSWGACEGCVTGRMIDALANDFLADGDDNDVHDWVTAIFGAPWGPHERTLLIPPEYGSEIHVLILSTEEEFAGYFTYLHNIRRDPERIRSSEYSNERLMFFVSTDAVAPSSGGRGGFLGTQRTHAARALAHEYQHLIRFYQRLVKNLESNTETWLNEMTSVVTEDLVAYKLMDHGNRGVRYDDPTAGRPPITRGRYGQYNYYNFLGVSHWEEEVPSGRYHSLNYALGSYLALTYGGAPFLAAMTQNEYTGTDAVEAALAAGGYEETSFADVLTDWAIANLLSDDTDAPFPHRYNSGDWSLSEAGGVSFRLGSVNLFNYRFRYGEGANDYHDGPWLFSVDAFNGADQAPRSNRYVHLGRQTGTVDLHLQVPAGVRVSLVVKE